MRMMGEGFELRPWQRGDEEALVRHADDEEVSRNLMDLFPYPYTRADAEAWIGRNLIAEGPATQFAIVVAGEPGGGIGFERLQDVYACTGRLGYWLGRSFWGRGIVTSAVRLVSAYAFREFDFERLEAEVFDWNPASRRVLEKAGFTLEARNRKRVVKRGVVMDGWLYARLRSNIEGETRV